MEFWKMQGAGNDFIIVDNRDETILDKSHRAVQACDRHFGMGADGFMLVEKSDTHDVKMVYYNSDGSLASMCGNGIRCFSKYVYDQGICTKKSFSVETGDGPKEINILSSEDQESVVCVNMGQWNFSSTAIIHNSKGQEYICNKIKIEDQYFEISCVYMGVPHCIIFTDEINEQVTAHYGGLIEKHPIFSQGTNVNFVQVIDEANLIVDTWERGAGKTLACGTGVCSAVIMANRFNKTSKEVYVKIAGGELKITLLPNSTALMEGKAVKICQGTMI